MNTRKLNAELSKLGISPKIASRLNNQFPSYVAYRPNGALLMAGYTIIPFPPVAIIVHRCWNRIVEEKARGVAVVPDWPTRSW